MIFYFDANGVKRVIEQARATDRSIMLVKEDGVFIKPDFLKNDPIKTPICYSNGSDVGDLVQAISVLEDYLGTGSSDEVFYLDAKEPIFDAALEKDGGIGIEFKIIDSELHILIHVLAEESAIQ